MQREMAWAYGVSAYVKSAVNSSPTAARYRPGQRTDTVENARHHAASILLSHSVVTVALFESFIKPAATSTQDTLNCS